MLHVNYQTLISNLVRMTHNISVWLNIVFILLCWVNKANLLYAASMTL